MRNGRWIKGGQIGHGDSWNRLSNLRRAAENKPVRRASYHRGYEVDQLAGSLGQLDELNILLQENKKQLEFSLMLRPHKRITDEYRETEYKMKVSLRGQTHFTL